MLQLKVLVLDSHPFQRALTVAALKNSGVTYVLEAQNGEEALAELAAVGGIDIVVCDLHMPVIFLRRACKANLIQAVIITNEVDTALHQGVAQMAGYLGLQFLGNLGKPLPMELLEALLRQFKRKSTGYPVKLSSTLECSDIAKNL